jgi:hypothetical protein
VSPADSGSPRAARRQERLQGPSNAREPALPVPELPEPGRQLPPTRPSDQQELLDNAPLQPGSVPPEFPASGLRSRGSVRLVPPVNALPRAARDL